MARCSGYREVMKQEGEKMPTLTHKFCQVSGCQQCLADHHALAEYIERETGNERMDHLQQYRFFLEQRQPAMEFETQWGWAHPDVFKDENVNAFIAYVRGDEEAPDAR